MLYRLVLQCLCKKKNINQWHNSCVRKFFGTEILPMIEVSEQQLEQLANETVNKGLTVPGVQKKMSLHLSKGKEKYSKKRFQKICSLKEKFLMQCEESYLPQNKIEKLKALIEQRIEILS